MLRLKLLKEIRELKNKNKVVNMENQELRQENYYTQEKIDKYEKQLNHIRELIEKFDYQKSNSVFIIRQIKDEFNS